MAETAPRSIKRPYTASLIGNIRQILTGLQGFAAMARELIQNADDARAGAMVFDIDEDALRIWNSGQFSNCETQEGHCPWEYRGNPISGTKRPCDFHAISTVGSGNKYREQGLIGRFGIGFVSVYQITDTPIIRSGNTQLELDPLAGQASETEVVLRGGSTFELPWCFDGRSSVREALNASPFLPEEIDILERDLVSVAADCLLFLRNLKSLEIRRNGVPVSKVAKTNPDNDDKRLRLTYDGSDFHEDWYVIHFDAHEAAAPLRQKYPVIERLDRQTTGQIAFRLGDTEERIGRLYAYLPTEQDSPIPCHINADFFPEQTRRALVLSGEQHERRWNEMLLQAVAREISSHLTELRDVLGAKRLWGLIDEAHGNRLNPHFRVFWNEIEKQATQRSIAHTALGEWVRPSECKIGPADFEKPEYDSLSMIGLQLLDPELSPHKRSFTALEGGSLTLFSFVDAWDRWLGDERNKEHTANVTAKTNAFMAPLWRIADRFVGETSPTSSTELRALDRLSSLPFVPSSEGSMLPIRSLFCLPKKLKTNQISEFFPSLSFVVDNFSKYPHLHEHIERLTLENLFGGIRSKADQDVSMGDWIGGNKARLRRFYELLADCPTGDDDPDPELVQDIPFLISSDGNFLTPKQAVIPSDFTDPVGRFDTLDMSFFEGRVEDLLKKRLHIEALTFERYIEEHLEEILDKGIEERQYAALVDELTSHLKILENDRLRRRLQDLPLVWTNSNEFRLPRDCYVKSTKLVEILGDDQSRWVKSSMLKRGTRDSFEKVFLQRLGMPEWPALQHVIERIEKIVGEGPSEERSTAVLHLLDIVFDIFQKGRINEKEDAYTQEIDWLRTTEWLPAINEGKLETRFWYAPHELYQHLRADGFGSQVPYLAIQPGQRPRTNKRFLDFLGMPAEPKTSDIVDHLLDCLEKEREPSKTTYELLSERLKKEDGLPSLERLLGQPIIYDPRTKRFLSPARVSWSKPPFPHYLYPAPKWMRDLEELFAFLGVEESPGLEAFVNIAMEIVETFEDSDLPAVERNILEECLAKMSSAIREKNDTVFELLSKLEGQPFLPTRSSTLGYVDEVVVCDNASLAHSFDGAIDHLLIEERLDQRELRNHLGLLLLSRRTCREAVDLAATRPDQTASTLLSERSSLLMWLVPSLGSQTANQIATSLRSTKIIRTDELTVRSVLKLQGRTIESEPKPQDALFVEDDGVLYVHGNLGDQFWIPAFRAVFESLAASELGVDVGHLAMCAYSVIEARDEAAARSILEKAGFREPSWTNTETIDYGETEGLGELSQASHAEDVVQEDQDSAGDSRNEDVEVVGDPDGIDEPQGNDQGLGNGKPPLDGEAPKRGNATDQHIRADRKEHEGGEGSGSSDGAEEPTNGEPKTPNSGNNDGRSKGENGEPRERKPSLRTQKLRSYVMPKGYERSSSGQIGSNKERIDEIDKAAMAAVVEWEGKRGFDPQVQPHYNPGFDIISAPKDGGETRYIEVKGLADAWTERGVKLSRMQMHFARDKGDDFWLYVVEHALDQKKRNVHAIRNPFEKSDEFWFDQGWIDIAEERSGDQRTLLAEGRRVDIQGWGKGTILKVDKIGIGIKLTIKFLLATKLLTYNSETFELLED